MTNSQYLEGCLCTEKEKVQHFQTDRGERDQSRIGIASNRGFFVCTRNRSCIISQESHKPQFDIKQTSSRESLLNQTPHTVHSTKHPET